MKFGYARVSSASQNLARQLDALRNAGVEDRNIYSEKVSGAKADRVELNKLLDHLREGDDVVVCSFDRLARSTSQLLQLAERFQSEGVNLLSLKESIDTSTPQGKLFFTVSSAFAEFERSIIRERQAEGIALAKAEGRMKGRPRVSQDKLDVACALYREGKHTMREIESIAGCSYGTIYRELKKRGITRSN